MIGFTGVLFCKMRIMDVLASMRFTKPCADSKPSSEG